MTTLTQTTELDARVVAARHGDLESYSWAVHGWRFEPYQSAWAEALESFDRVVIVCPPDTYKSTTVRMFVERLIGKDHNVRILWLMNSGEQATKQAMTVASTLSSNNIHRRAFGVREDSNAQWTKSVLFVERDYTGPDPTLMASGINGPYQGSHFNLIIIDDPTNQEDVRSPTTMEAQRAKIRGVVLDRLIEGGRIVVILTRWGDNDLVPTFEEMGFSIITMPVVGDYDWGPTLSPRRFPLTRVEQIHRDKGDVLFNLTYMCNAQAILGNAIKRDHILYWDEPPEHPMSFFMGVDPAASLRTMRDYSCIATIGLDLRTKKKYLVDLWAARVEVPDLRAELVRRGKRVVGLRQVGLETIGFQLSMMQDMKRMNVLPMVEIPYRTRRQVMHKVKGIDRDKFSRALYLDAQFTSGRLYLCRNLPLVEGVSLEAELCSVPNGKHDDRMDAICFASILADSVSQPRVSFKMSGW